jgi:hypothetical protein
MRLYRFLTGAVGLDFNRRVTAALNEDWELHGDPVFFRDEASGQMMAGQAVIRETDDGTDYDVRVLIDGVEPGEL